jgi:ribosomal protein S18 acetylase RimI-like enzyme
MQQAGQGSGETHDITSLFCRKGSSFPGKDFGQSLAPVKEQKAMYAIPEIEFKPVFVPTRAGRKLEVRAYGPQDFAALVEMYKTFEPKRVAQGLPATDVPRIANWIDKLQQKSRSLLAWDGKRIVGHAILCPIDPARVEFTIFVHQDFREVGLGTALTRLALKFSGDMGFEKVLLTTEYSNFRAVSLYKKIGFKISGSYGNECEMSITLLDGEGNLPKAA